MIAVRKIATCSGHTAALYALAPGRDARHFLTAGGDGWIAEWSLDDPSLGKVVAAVDERIFSLATLADLNRLVAGSMTGSVFWIDRNQPEKTRRFLHHNNKGVFAAAVCGEWVLTAGGDGKLTRWATASAQPIESLQLSRHALRSLAFNEKLGLLAVGSSDRNLYLLDLKTFEIKKTLAAAHANTVFSCAFSPDGKRLLTGGGDAMLRVWDAEADFGLHNEQPAHNYAIYSMVYSPDQSEFATASRDKTIKFWDAQNFELLKVVSPIRDGGHFQSVNRLLWTREMFVSCSDDRSAMLWKIECPKSQF